MIFFCRFSDSIIGLTFKRCSVTLLYVLFNIFRVKYFTLFSFHLSMFWKNFSSRIMVTGILFKVFLWVNWRIMLSIYTVWISKPKKKTALDFKHIHDRNKWIKKMEIASLSYGTPISNIFLLYACYRCTWTYTMCMYM